MQQAVKLFSFFLLFFLVPELQAEQFDKTVVILLGPPGSGKGTQADMIKSTMNLPHISTGDLFRHYLKEAPKTDKIAQELRDFVNSGNLVPDQLIIDILKERLKEPDAKKGYILDGFPRTLSQGESLTRMLGQDDKPIVFYFAVPDDVIIKRIEGRQSCVLCNIIYNRFFSPPLKEGLCDECGKELTTRADDNAESIKKRLEVYHSETKPLIEYYTKKGELVEINAEQDKQQIFKQVMDAYRARTSSGK